MEFFCDIKLLNEAVFNVSLAVSLKSTFPALEGILIKANNNKITLTGYNLEIGITKEIDAKVKKEGSIIVNSKIFGDILRRLPGENVDIKVDEKMLITINSLESEFNIMGINENEYPDLPDDKDGKGFLINQAVLKNMINQTIFAISTNEATPVITGCLFEINDKVLKIVAVDGFRLAIRKENINVDEDFSFIIPGKTLNDINKLLKDDGEKQVQIIVSKKHIVFKVDGYEVISRLIEGEFLDYKAALAGEASTEIRISTREFNSIIDRASIIIADRLKSPIKCEINDDIVSISCVTQIGKVFEKFRVNKIGDDITIGFNNKYMSDALKASDCDEVIIKMNGAISPIKIEPISGDSFLFLVLPVRLKVDND